MTARAPMVAADGTLTGDAVQQLRLCASGLTIVQTARRLGISVAAASQRMVRIRRALGATTNPHAVAVAFDRRILTAGEVRP